MADARPLALDAMLDEPVSEGRSAGNAAPGPQLRTQHDPLDAELDGSVSPGGPADNSVPGLEWWARGQPLAANILILVRLFALGAIAWVVVAAFALGIFTSGKLLLSLARTLLDG